MSSKKELFQSYKSSTCGEYTGGGFVTREMMERESIGHLIKETRVRPNHVLINVGPTHILRRPIPIK
jgi:hypothetical protein